MNAMTFEGQTLAEPSTLSPDAHADALMSVGDVRRAVGAMVKTWSAQIDLERLRQVRGRAEVNALTDAVNSRWTRFKQRIVARIALIRALSALEGDLALDFALAKPGVPVRLRVGEPLRGHAWAVRAREAHLWADRLYHLIADRNLSPDRLAGAIIASAAMNGLLLQPGGWAALAAWLRQPDSRLFKSPVLHNMPFMIFEEGTWRLAWFPDAVTLALMGRWFASGAYDQAPTGDGPAVFAAMERVLWPEGRPSGSTIRTAKQFAEVAFAPLEDLTGAELPQALVEMALARLSATALPLEIWQAALRRPHRGRVARVDCPKSNTRSGSRRSGASAVSTHGAVLKIEEIIRKPAAGRRLSRLEAQRALDALPKDDWPHAVILLARWYLTLLRQRREVTTVDRYHSSIGKVFAAVAGDTDLFDIDSASLDALCERVLDLRPRAGWDYGRDRLAQLLRYGQSDPAFLLPEADIAPGGASSSVRPMLVSKSTMDAIVAAIDASPILNAEKREIYSIAVIMSARGGFRVDELAGTLAADVTADEWCTVFIRNNAHRGLKTEAARRNVPVRLLLTPDERTRFDAFVDARRAEIRASLDAGHKDLRLLESGVGLLVKAVFDPAEFRAVLRAASRAVGGPEALTPHGLRHSALSMLQLALLEDAPFVTELTGWTSGQIADLRRAFIGRGQDGGRLYDALASLAGHESPTTTSHSYLHLGDLALGLRLARIRRSIDPEQAARAFGLNARTVGREEAFDPETLRSMIIARLPTQTINIGRKRSLAKRRRQPKAPKMTPALAWRILDAIDGGASADEVARDSGVAVTQVEMLDRRVKRLTALLTQKRRPRLVRPDESAMLEERLVLPKRPRNVEERDLALAICGRLRGLDRRVAAQWCIAALLDSEPHHPGARHYDPATAQAWMDVLTPLVPPENWRVTLLLAAEDDKDSLMHSWRDGLATGVELRPRGTQAQERGLRLGRALVVNCGPGEVDERVSRWPVVHTAAFIAVALDDRILKSVEAADHPRCRRRRRITPLSFMAQDGSFQKLLDTAGFGDDGSLP
jgi:integrase